MPDDLIVTDADGYQHTVTLSKATSARERQIVSAAAYALTRLQNMTTREFARGDDQEIRAHLFAALVGRPYKRPAA